MNTQINTSVCHMILMAWDWFLVNNELSEKIDLFQEQLVGKLERGKTHKPQNLISDIFKKQKKIDDPVM